MTLYRQIAISIIVLCILGFLGTVTISTNNMRSFLVTQLESHAQDTATSLGLSLSEPMRTEDMPVIQSMIDAIFDRGYYRDIKLVATGGETLIERSTRSPGNLVPEWFATAIPLRSPTAEAIVMAGWKQAARIHVTSHPGNAYSELWSNTVDTFRLFLVAATVILALALLAVKYLLRPLYRVEQQADAICNRSYPVQEKLPRTRELRRVVTAMNRLSEKVGRIFSEQSVLTEQLREQVYRDPVTGLGNRRYFNRQLMSLIGNREDPAEGILLLLEMNGLAKVNETSGYITGDRLLGRTAELINSRLGTMVNCFAARLSGAVFGIVVTGLDRAGAGTLAGDLCHDLGQLHMDGLAGSEDTGHIGISTWKPGDTPAGVLSAADVALRAAQSTGQNTWQYHEPPGAEQTENTGSQYWRAFLQQAIENEEIAFDVQPVCRQTGAGGELLHKEVFIRIRGQNGNNVNAGIFMPMAERTGLASRIDKLAIGKLMSHLASTAHDTTAYAVNLSSTSLHDSAFREWLYDKLQGSPALAKRLLIEFTEYGLLMNLESSGHFIDRLDALGCRCGIDHFGKGFSSFGYLHTMKVSYIKIDGSYIRDIDKEGDNRFFLKALSDAAHRIDIRVIAQSVETEAERNTVESMQLDGIQGFLSGRPEPLQGVQPDICMPMQNALI
jgi:diguanylate cyclase (GGDEF)-like protein